jgi:sugar phosphate isomerase/epimerase
MDNQRLISIAAGVSPELADDPCTFVELAAKAGWRGTGIWYAPSSWTESTTREISKRVRDTGLTVVDMEVVRMGPEGDCGEGLIEAAAAIGAKNILTVSQFDEIEATAERLNELCTFARAVDIRICLEFMRFTTVQTLADALQVVQIVDQDNVGILVDLIHVFRSGTTYEDIRAADSSFFPYAQWCDAPTEPCGWSTKELIRDALDDRSIPGEGDMPVNEFESLFDLTVPFSIEVRSKSLRDGFPDFLERAKHLLSATSTAMTFAG